MSRLRNAERAGKPELAQFFTPLAVAEFTWKVARFYAGPLPGKALSVLDPAAGTGIFLRAIAETACLRSADRQGEISGERLCGIEIDPQLIPPLGEGPPIFCGNALLDHFPGLEPGIFQVVIGNPPFGRLGEIAPQTLTRKEWEGYSIWKACLPRQPQGRLATFPIELLFVERALQLAKPGGVIALIMPEGFFANARLQTARDWVRQQAEVLATVGLPAQVFCRSGLNARTGVVFLRRKQQGRRTSYALLIRPPCPIGRRVAEARVPLDQYLKQALRTIEQPCLASRQGNGAVQIPEKWLAGARWDAGFWQEREGVGRLGRPAGRRSATGRRFAWAPLGDFIHHLTYGPIVTGCRPVHVPDGIRLIRQEDFTEIGLCPTAGLRVAVGSPYDLPRSRVHPRDLLLPRSGAGTLGRNRMAVYLSQEPANISCFVDLVRLVGINPFYVWFFFKTESGWRQIQSLINGTGVPNINFAEIRSLRLPLLPPAEQDYLEQRYLQEVLPCLPVEPAGGREDGEAVRRFRRIIGNLEAFLAGQACLR